MEALHSSYEHSPKVKKKNTGRKFLIVLPACHLVQWEENNNTVVSADNTARAQFLCQREHNSYKPASCVSTSSRCEHHAFDMH